MGSLGLVALASGAYLLGGFTVFGTAVWGPECDEVDPPAVASSGGGRIVLRIQEQTQDREFLVCVVDAEHETVVLETLEVGPGRDVERVYRVAVASHSLSARTAGFGAGDHGIHLQYCPFRAYAVTIEASGVASGCARSPPASDPSPEANTVPSGVDAGLAGLGLAGLGATAGGFLLVRFWEHPRWLFAVLFTRLQRPRVLDQGVRHRIHQLVASEPGIFASQICRRLELSTGHAAYHLRVMTREKALVDWKTVGHRHYFPHGRYSREQMRTLVTMRHRTLRRLYHHVLSAPGQSVRAASEELDVSAARVSLLARRLEEVGVIRRVRDGRSVRLDAVPTASEG